MTDTERAARRSRPASDNAKLAHQVRELEGEAEDALEEECEHRADALHWAGHEGRLRGRPVAHLAEWENGMGWNWIAQVHSETASGQADTRREAKKQVDAWIRGRAR